LDNNTPEPFVEDLTQYGDVQDAKSESKLAAKPNHIYMDAVGVSLVFSKITYLNFNFYFLFLKRWALEWAAVVCK
jgi:hypothetical protein